MINYGMLYEFYWLQSVPLVTSLGELATISGKSRKIRQYKIYCWTILGCSRVSLVHYI